PDGTAEIDGIPVTSMERTMLDLAEVESKHRLERALEESVRLDKLSSGWIKRLACPQHCGHQQTMPGQLRVADRVDTGVDRVQPAGPEAVLHRLARKAEFDELAQRDNPILRVRQRRDRQIRGRLQI
ncbi:MAG TPA: hypothetical protein VJU79_02180, partial [Candidatus Dormibacteraeota bacterium]|nr:hypothetical protein [Candidatus Dormibacteraeota bacterium]